MSMYCDSPEDASGTESTQGLAYGGPERVVMAETSAGTGETTEPSRVILREAASGEPTETLPTPPRSSLYATKRVTVVKNVIREE